MSIFDKLRYPSDPEKDGRQTFALFVPPHSDL